MPRSVTVHQVDVFTRRRFTGNPAGVVLDADGLTDPQMAAIAREMNLSETAFVFEAGDGDEVPVRFFTPVSEVPVCGHATLGAHYVRASERGITEGAATQRSPGARWTVRWEPSDGSTLVTMRQGPIEYGPELGEPDIQRLLAALGVAAHDLEPESPVRIVSTGHAKVMVPVRSPEVLEAIQPAAHGLRALSEATGVGGYFVFAADDAHRDTATVCRVFAPAIGIEEDPVNGSGHGPLGAYLLARGGEGARRVREGLWSRMGEHLGRPGRVWVRAAPDGRSVDVGGYVTPVFRATMAVD